MRVLSSIALITALVGVVSACANDNAAVPTVTTQAATTHPATTSTTIDFGNCPGFGDQRVPQVDSADEIVQIETDPYPEGVVMVIEEENTASYLTPKSAAELDAVFADTRRAIPRPLPAVLAQQFSPLQCCLTNVEQFTLVLTFASGKEASYGPCNIPAGLYDVTIRAETRFAAVLVHNGS